MATQSLLAALLQARVVGRIEQQPADVERDRKPLLFLLREGGLLRVVACAGRSAASGSGQRFSRRQ